MRIAIITDSHLSPRAPECVANWRAAGRAVERLAVDLTIHLGDISFDGQTHAEELAFAAALVAEWPTPLRCLPGNHDVGDGSGEQPFRPELLAAYRALFGADRWIVCTGDWQVIGINAQLFGIGSAEEAAQWAWLEEHASWATRQTRTVLCLHRPVLRPAPSEDARSGRYVPAAARERLLGGPLGQSLQMVLSGHTHQWLDQRQAGPVRHLWVPSCAFILPDEMQARIGEKVVGFGVLDLGGPSAAFDLHAPDAMIRHEVTGLPAFRSTHEAPAGDRRR